MKRPRAVEAFAFLLILVVRPDAGQDDEKSEEERGGGGDAEGAVPCHPGMIPAPVSRFPAEAGSRRCPCRVPRATRGRGPRPQEPDGAPPGLGPRKERRRPLRDRGRLPRRRALRVAPRDRREVGVAELQRHGPRGGAPSSRATRRPPPPSRSASLPLGGAGREGRAGYVSSPPARRRRPGPVRLGGRRRRGRGPTSVSAQLPTVRRRSAGSAPSTSTSLSIPTARSFAAVTGPTPQSASTGSFREEPVHPLRGR